MSKFNYKKILSIAKKFIEWIKKSTRELLVGIIVGVIVLVLTPTVEQYVTQKNTNRYMKENISSISLGMSKGHIDGMLGYPIVEFKKETLDVSNEDSEYVVANYKLPNCVVLCLYHNDTTIAFAVTVNSDKVYSIPRSMYLNSEKYLFDFTYYDFSNIVDEAYGNVPADNDDSAYYYELHYGHNPANFDYYIIGNYKDYSRSNSNLLYHIGQKYLIEKNDGNINDTLSSEELKEYHTLRQKVKPNVFGMVSSEYIEDFDFLDLLGSSAACGLLYDDWIK